MSSLLSAKEFVRLRALPMPPKNLFDSDSDNDDVPVQQATSAKPKKAEKVAVNNAYAEKYDAVKRKQELQRLTAKYGDDLSDEEEDEEDYSSEDDDAVLLSADKEVAFAEVFNKIRRNPDEILSNKEIRFFPLQEDEAKNDGEKSKKFLMKEEYQRRIQMGESVEDLDVPERDETTVKRVAPKSKKEKELRDAFLAATKESTDQFDVKLVASAPKDVEKDTKKKKAAQLLTEAFDVNNDDEKFLQKFFVNELWKPQEGVRGEEDLDWETIAKEEADEIFYDDADQWERDFQEKMYRHEEGEEALKVQTFPRQQEGLLRKKDETRKEARERREQRKEEAAARHVEDLKRLKTLKRKEIDEQKALIAKVAGIKNLEKIGITREFLEKDFDPVEFDKKMAAMFDHDYDHEIDDDEIALLDDELDNVDDINLDEVDPEEAEAAATSDVDDDFEMTFEETMAKAKSGKKKAPTSLSSAAKPSFLQDDDLAMLYPEQAIKELEHTAPRASVSANTQKSADELERELEKKVDEYWRLHYHKLAGDVRTRFKYREVNQETFGLNDLDVLTKDDRQLNMIAPMNCYAAYLGKNENLRDRYKALHRRTALREISSDRGSRKYKDVQKTAIFDEAVGEEEGQQILQKVREGTKKLLGEKSVEEQRPPRNPVKRARDDEPTKVASTVAVEQQQQQRRPKKAGRRE